METLFETLEECGQVMTDRLRSQITNAIVFNQNYFEITKCLITDVTSINDDFMDLPKVHVAMQQGTSHNGEVNLTARTDRET